MWNTKTQIIIKSNVEYKTQIINKIQCGIQKHKSYKIQCGIQKHKSSIKSNVEYKNTNHK